MTLLARMDLAALSGGTASTGSGNWGYTAGDGRRFALNGLFSGLSVVDVTDPTRPRLAGFVPGPSSTWREVKTWGTYAYVTTEARGHGLDIVDLGSPDAPRKVRTWSDTFGSAHTLWIDDERGLLFANGTRDASGRDAGMRILDLTRDPEDPREVGDFTGFYVHDAYAREDVLYASAISDGFLALLDVSRPSSVREITRFPTGGRFTHNSWLSRDGRYLFTTDEVQDRPVEVWDLVDPRQPRKVAEYIGAAGSIPHNVMVDGDRLLISHYTEGVHLLDVRNPERPALLGSYDTFTDTTCGSRFCGAWGAYIFPGSDLIVVGDMQGGLFIVRSLSP